MKLKATLALAAAMAISAAAQAATELVIATVNNGHMIEMEKLGKKRLKLHLQGKVDTIPAPLTAYNLEFADDGRALIYNYDTKGERTGITSLLSDLRGAGIRISDLDTTQSSLEDIFVSLVRAS